MLSRIAPSWINLRVLALRSFLRFLFIEELKKLGREDIVVIAGGVIPAQDYDFLYKAGVAAIFGPGTPVAKAACQILEILMDEE